MNKDIMLKFDFKLISKDNEKIRNSQGRYYLSPKYKVFEQLIKDTAFLQMRNLKFEPFDKNAHLEMKIFAYFETKVHPDMWNLPKSLADALQNVVYHNDRQIKAGEISITENWKKDTFNVYIKQI